MKSLFTKTSMKIVLFAMALPVLMSACGVRGDTSRAPAHVKSYVLLFPKPKESADSVFAQLCNDQPLSALGGIRRSQAYYELLDNHVIVRSAATSSNGARRPWVASLSPQDGSGFKFVGYYLVGPINKKDMLLRSVAGDYYVLAASDYTSLKKAFHLPSYLIAIGAKDQKFIAYDRIRGLVLVYQISSQLPATPQLIARIAVPKMLYGAALGDAEVALAWFEPGGGVPKLHVEVRTFDGKIQQQASVADAEVDLVGVQSGSPVVLSRQEGGFRCPMLWSAGRWVPATECQEDIYSARTTLRGFSAASFSDQVIDIVYRDAREVLDESELSHLIDVRNECVRNMNNEKISILLSSGFTMHGLFHKSKSSQGLVVYFEGGPFAPLRVRAEGLISELLQENLDVLIAYPPGTAGFGGDYRAAFTSFEGSVDLSREFVNKFLEQRQQSGKVLAAGASFGGQYAVALARAMPRVSGLVLLDPACLVDSERHLMRASNQGLGYIVRQLRSPAPCDDLPGQPLFVYQNRRDDRVSPWATRFFFSRARQDNKVFVSGPGGHGDIDKRLFAVHFSEWMNTIEGKRDPPK